MFQVMFRIPYKVTIKDFMVQCFGVSSKISSLIPKSWTISSLLNERERKVIRYWRRNISQNYSLQLAYEYQLE